MRSPTFWFYWEVYARRVHTARPTRFHRLLLRWGWHLHPSVKRARREGRTRTPSGGKRKMNPRTEPVKLHVGKPLKVIPPAARRWLDDKPGSLYVTGGSRHEGQDQRNATARQAEAEADER